MDLRALPLEPVVALGGLLLAFALVQSFRLWWRSWVKRRALALARERGAQGEVRAELLLRRLGFGIVGRQVAITYGLALDGERIAVDLRADYVVSKDGRRYVAEVKTGRLAPRIDTPATRRQLLEYRLAFDVDGVLLVDADSDRVRAVEFPLPASRPVSRLAWLLAGIAAGAIGATLARMGL